MTAVSDIPANGDVARPHFGAADFGYCHFAGFFHYDRYSPETPAALDHACRQFTGARFEGEARFHGARFSGDIWFIGASFGGDAGFGNTRFEGNGGFAQAKFAGSTHFGAASFEGDAWFGSTRFDDEVVFKGARFHRGARFSRARFAGRAVFDDAQFAEAAKFGHAEFREDCLFDTTRFDDEALFDDTRFGKSAEFVRTRFGAAATFEGARFRGSAWFRNAHFEEAARFGPVVATVLVIDGASFARRVVVEAEAGSLTASDTRFEAGAELRVRRAQVTLRRAYFGAPSSLSGSPAPFTRRFSSLVVETDPEMVAQWPGSHASGSIDVLEPWVPSVLSVQETDVSQVTLADVDLRWCRFAGAHQLDKLKLEGRGPFNRPPTGWRCGWAWPPVWHWSRRRVLAEEHPWRAERRKHRGWSRNLPNLGSPVTFPPLSPERLAVLYRSLRKAFEDAKNEPGAGDFYFGEMEARRHSGTTSRRERVLLTLYWMISGYGQRAGRALSALVVLVAVIFALLTQFGLTNGTGVQEIVGPFPAATGQPPTTVYRVQPVESKLPAPDKRWTPDRMDKAIRIALGSVVFRETDQKLTPVGFWTVMAGRALGPLLVALAVLAIRARVKR
nr:pentapeptide repeat-containing protein [Amycolatopsis umgeniensis]